MINFVKISISEIQSEQKRWIDSAVSQYDRGLTIPRDPDIMRELCRSQRECITRSLEMQERLQQISKQLSDSKNEVKLI